MSRDVLRDLDPALGQWFRSQFPGATEIQKKALPLTGSGKNTLILAPTGSGKTLSAFLSALSTLAKNARRAPLANAVAVVYVSPLKSLDRDIQRNLEAPLAAINNDLPPAHRIRISVR